MRYGKWTIVYNPKPIPVKGIDYDAVHDDYDGEDVSLCLIAGSFDEAKEMIDDLEDEL